MPAPSRGGRAGLVRPARAAITAWALLGGLVLVAVVLINVLSVIGGVVWRPFPGDFEMTEIGIAVAAFAFLPYCQLTGANVTADIFTSWASPRCIAGFSLLAASIALALSLLLLGRKTLGLHEQKAYGYTTATLQFPPWVAFVPILIPLALHIGNPSCRAKD